MTQNEFDTLKTIIQEADILVQTRLIKDPEFEVDSVKGKLSDGVNLIDLYVEFRVWAAFHGPESEEMIEQEDWFWEAVQEVLVEPEEKRFVFALCDRQGMFEELETLCQSEIIAEETEENDDGTYYLEYLDGMGQETNAYFLTKKEI